MSGETIYLFWELPFQGKLQEYKNMAEHTTPE